MPLRTFTRWLTRRLPRLESDIVNVVYLNWLLPVERVRSLVPKALTIDAQDGMAWLTILTFRHGHYRPTALRWLKRLFPSPLQSNCRVYVKPTPGCVYFLSVALGNRLFTTISRLFSDALPARAPRAIEHSKNGDVITTNVDPGLSLPNSIDFSSQVRIVHDRPEEWHSRLEYILPQNHAISVPTDLKRPVQADIALGFNMAEVLPCHVERFESQSLSDIIRDTECFAFYVPRVTFHYLGEHLLT